MDGEVGDREGDVEPDGFAPLEGLTIVLHTETEAAAQQAATTLVERGIGAEVVPGGGGETRFAVAVLLADSPRACDLLGVERQQQDDDDTDQQLTRSTRNMLIPVLIGIAAFLIVPLLAFLISFKLSGG
jgi:hypothetical protein